MPETYFVSAVGCKVNQYEAQQLREALASAGLRPAPDGQIPDLAVVNTCAVTQTAAKKSRQLVRRATRAGQTRVIVVGCGATDEPQRYLGIKGVIGVIGHDDDLAARLPHFLNTTQTSRRSRNSSTAESDASAEANDPASSRWGTLGTVLVAPHSAGAAYSDNPIQTKASPSSQVKWDLGTSIHRMAGHQRAFLKVQDGCDAACTYCVIPRLRRRLRSKPVDAAVAEARDLVAAGHREIVVTGIFLGAYGRETARRSRHNDGATPLAELTDAIASVPGLLRLRLSSLNPGDVTEDLLDVLARRDPCVPHLHLPLQAGADAVLRRMNRQYRLDDYLATIDRVRSALDRPAITTDIIVGFPGESDEAFEQTLDVVKCVGFARVHAFPFSPRPGTAAECWRDQQLDHAVVHERMQRLRALADQTALAFRRQFIGQPERVIVEEQVADINQQSQTARRDIVAWRGRADRYFRIWFPAPPLPDLRAQAVSVRVQDVKDEHSDVRAARLE